MRGIDCVLLMYRNLTKLHTATGPDLVNYAPQRGKASRDIRLPFSPIHIHTPTKHRENIAVVGSDGRSYARRGEGGVGIPSSFVARRLLRLEQKDSAVAEVEVYEVLRLCCV